MHKPIIHNLTPDCAGYNEAQAYNALIGKKPKGAGTLAEKLKAIDAWEDDCEAALDAVKGILASEINALPMEQIIGNPDAVKLQSTFNQLARMGDNN